MRSSCVRRLTQCLLLTFVTLWVAPVCLLSQHVSNHLHFENEWGSWNDWSACSRTCGGGASVRTRVCITRNPVGGPCPGDTRQYKICNTRDCLVGSVDFREMQCSAFNDRPLVGGKSYTWTTFHGGSSSCELSCLAIGYNFYYNFGRVLDGTSCETEPGAKCVNGRCLKPGCDLILGSDLQDDACMVCGGHNTTCLRYHSIYNSLGHGAEHFGYNKVTMIPAGATHVRVTDNSKNYLALQNGHSQFVINGNWKISVPGEYAVAGTKLHYQRSADTWESFEVLGPTQEDLQLMVLSTDKNPGVEYEYWLPADQYALHHGKMSQLRQHHHTAVYSPWQPATTTTSTTKPTYVTQRPFWGDWPVHPPRQQPLPRLEREENHRNLLPNLPLNRHCGKCRRVRGRGERKRQYCQKDFVFRAKVLGKLQHGEETRYDVQIIHTYRNRYRLEHREFLWVPNICDCPLLEEGREYILMARRHINYEHTLNRILLEPGSYVQPYRPREDALLRPLDELCSNRGPRMPSQRRTY